MEKFQSSYEHPKFEHFIEYFVVQHLKMLRAWHKCKLAKTWPSSETYFWKGVEKIPIVEKYLGDAAN